VRTKPARIEPGCPYCDNDHDPAITCRNVASCLQQEMRPKAAQPKPTIILIRDAAGNLIGVRKGTL
jgi:hypothetical protein